MRMTIDEVINHIKYGIIEGNYPLPRNLGVEACNIAIDTMRKYQMMQANYENRLKADMVAILTDIQLEIEEEKRNTKHLHYDDLENVENYNNGIDNCIDIIQARINKLKKDKK